MVLSPERAADLWRDVGRWGGFVEGFQRIEEITGEWPGPGSRVVWHSIPAGRGQVTEKVVDSGARRFATRVAEKRLMGTQTATFDDDPDGALVRVELEYELSRQGPAFALADAIFIRRALRDMLRRTLRRFAVEAEDERGLR